MYFFVAFCAYYSCKGIMQAWLPLSETILSMVVELLPDPKTAQQIRIPHLFTKHTNAAIVLLRGLRVAIH